MGWWGGGVILGWGYTTASARNDRDQAFGGEEIRRVNWHLYIHISVGGVGEQLNFFSLGQNEKCVVTFRRPLRYRCSNSRTVC